MADLDEAKIAEIVSRVMSRINAPTPSDPICGVAPPVYTPGGAPAMHTRGRQPGVFDDMDRAVGRRAHRVRAVPRRHAGSPEPRRRGDPRLRPA